MSTHASAGERSELLNFLRAIFGGEPGLVCLATGNVTRDNRLTNFEDRFFSWPKQANKLVEFALDRRDDSDVYFCPRLRGRASRRKGTGLPGRWLFADLDQQPAGHQADLLDELTRRGAVVVASGSPDRRHVYVPLEQVQSLEELEVLNRRLGLGLAADAAVVQDNALLRVPGTFNHKATFAGGRRRPVRFLTPCEGTPLDLESLDRLLPALPAPALAAQPPGDAVLEWDGTVPEHITRLQEETAEKGDRSESTFALVMAAIEAGLPYEATVDLAHGHQPTADRDRVEGDVRLIYEKHPHLGQRCGSVGCPNATSVSMTTAQKRRHIDAVLDDLGRQQWSGRRDSQRKLVTAACQLAWQLGDTEFYLSEREFALLAGVARGTVRRNLPQLGDWLDVVARGDRQDATLYRVVTRRAVPQSPQCPAASTHEVCGPTWGPARDAFRHGALNGSARRVYFDALAHGKKTAVECADDLHLAGSTVRKALKRLAEHDLARCVDGRWERVKKTPDEWTAIAQAEGKLGVSERQEQRVLFDRRLRTHTDLQHAKHERAHAAHRRAAAAARGSARLERFWAIEEVYWAAEVAGAVGGVVQRGAQRDTFAGRVAREIQEQSA